MEYDELDLDLADRFIDLVINNRFSHDPDNLIIAPHILEDLEQRGWVILRKAGGKIYRVAPVGNLRDKLRRGTFRYQYENGLL